MVAVSDPKFAPALNSGGVVANSAADILVHSEFRSDDLSMVKSKLAGTIIDGLVAIVTLLGSHGQGHADTIARSLFEPTGDLFHLCSGDDGGRAYLRRMQMSSALMKQANAEDLIIRRKDDAASAHVIELAKGTAKEAKEIIVELSALGAAKERLSITTRLSAAGLNSEVVGIYADCCFDAHHDISILRKRHYRGNELVIGDTLDINSAHTSLVLGTMLVSAAMSTIPLFAKSVAPDYPVLLKTINSHTDAILTQWTSLTNDAMTQAGLTN